jgi:hypothetical protein
LGVELEIGREVVVADHGLQLARRVAAACPHIGVGAAVEQELDHLRLAQRRRHA